jgi:hypothetical protein
MCSVSDLSRSCIRYIFMENYLEIVKSEENTNVEKKVNITAIITV